MKGFVYRGSIDEAGLRQLAGQLFGEAALCHILEDLEEYRPGSGLPVDFKRKGRLFADIAELRYERAGDRFECLLLTESEAAFPLPGAFVAVPGDWESTEAEQMLAPLDAPHVNPLFPAYPHEARTISVRVYRNCALPMFTRFRRFES